MRIALAAALLALGCHHDAPPAPPAPPPSQCAKMADHIIGLMRAAKHAPQEVVDKTTNLFIAHCDGDHWAPEAQTCFLQMTELSQGDRCQQFLTPGQLHAINRAADAALGKKPQ